MRAQAEQVGGFCSDIAIFCDAYFPHSNVADNSELLGIVESYMFINVPKDCFAFIFSATQ